MYGLVIEGLSGVWVSKACRECGCPRGVRYGLAVEG